MTSPMNPINQRLIDLTKENKKLRKQINGSTWKRKVRKFLRDNAGWIAVIVVALLLLQSVGTKLIGEVLVHVPVDPGVVIVAFVVALIGTGVWVALNSLKK